MTQEQFITDFNSGQKEFKNADMQGLDLSGLNLTDCDFRKSRMQNVKFINCNCTRVNFGATFLDGADFTGAIIDAVDWELAKGLSTIKLIGALYSGQALLKPQ